MSIVDRQRKGKVYKLSHPYIAVQHVALAIVLCIQSVVDLEPKDYPAQSDKAKHVYPLKPLKSSSPLHRSTLMTVCNTVMKICEDRAFWKVLSDTSNIENSCWKVAHIE